MKPQLTERDCEVLDHVVRYRLTTLDSLHKAFFAKSLYQAVGKVTRRLVRNGWLIRHALGPRRCYFTLSPLSARMLRCPSGTPTKALRSEVLLDEYGLLTYCCQAEHQRKRLSREELDKDWPQLVCDESDSSRYFLDSGYRPSRCGMLWVDRGEDFEQFLANCRKDWNARCRRAAFRRHIGQGGFRLVIVTATEERASMLQQQIDDHPPADGAQLSVEVLPQLLPLYLMLSPFRLAAQAKYRRGSPKANGGGQTTRQAMGTWHNAGAPQIMPRDFKLLQHLLRNRIATPRSIHTDLFPGLCRHAEVLVASRLVRNGWVSRHMIGPQRCYYTLSPRAAQLFGNPPSALTGPLPPVELACQYSLVKYCSMRGHDRRRLTTEDLESDYPQLLCPGLDSDRYFLDSGRRPAMPGMVWHDDCADAAETVAACWQDWERRWRHARFRKYVTANGFGIVILIAAASRATAIRSELRKQRWPRCVRPSVQVLRELEHIAAGAKSK